MTFEQQVTLTTLESLLVSRFRPTFLALTMNDDGDTIQVVLSCNAFNIMPISQRVISVFNEIDKELPHLVSEYLVVLQAFNGEEIERVIDDVFQEAIEEQL